MPSFDDVTRVRQRVELVFVEALVAESAVKRFAVSLFSWHAGIDKVKSHLAIAGPASHRDACQLRTVVYHDRRRIAARECDLVKNTRDSHARKRRIDFDRSTFTCEIIDYIERSNPTSRSKRVVHEI